MDSQMKEQKSSVQFISHTFYFTNNMLPLMILFVMHVYPKMT